MKPTLTPYKPGARDSLGVIRPLLITSSGGGGHLAAMKGIIDFLQTNFDGDLELTLADYSFKATACEGGSKRAIEVAVKLQHELGLFSLGLRKLLERTSFPILPKQRLLDEEVKRLRASKEEPALYVDVLLDVFGESGFLSAAIVNLLARSDDIVALKKLIAFHKTSDALNSKIVETYFYNLLVGACKKGRPYTEIISTQVMCLQGIAKAVAAYNKWVGGTPHVAPPVRIQQYLTDLPSDKALHFLNPLNKLSSSQKSLFYLYGLGLSEEVIDKHLRDAKFYKGLYNIPPDKNPMVRDGFYDQGRYKHHDWQEDIYLSHCESVGTETESSFAERKITAGDKVASIMLGSQASDVMIDYLRPLIANSFKHIYLFCGGNKKIHELVEQLIESYPQELRAKVKESIACLGMQSDKEITPILTRSNVVIMRGGGLSVMEQMAMPHHPEQVIYYHQAEKSENLKSGSGLVWEDGNIELLQQFLDSKYIYSERVSPSLFNELLDAKEEMGAAGDTCSLLRKFSLFNEAEASAVSVTKKVMLRA